MTSPDLERHLFNMRAIADGTGQSWERDFARSVLTQSRRRNWKPSVKQAEVMRRLIFERFSGTTRGELVVIE